MPNKKPLLDASLADMFDHAIESEQSRRSERQRSAQLARKEAEARAAAARKAEAKKAAAEKAFEKRVTGETFPALAKLVNGVFDKSKRLLVRITTDAAMQATNFELTLQAREGQSGYAPPPKDNDYWMTATVRGGELSIRRWGRAVDPQYRGYESAIAPEELSRRVAELIIRYADDSELKKLRQLVKKARPAPKPAAPPAPVEGIVINRPLQLKIPPASGTP